MNLSIKVELLTKLQQMPSDMKDGLKKGLLQGGELIRAAATAPVGPCYVCSTGCCYRGNKEKCINCVIK